MILHSMQSAILDDKSSPRAYPRDEITGKQDAQSGSTMSGFGRHLIDFLKYVNYEMPAEEANSTYACKLLNYGFIYLL
jgi:hypothetical protein